MEFGQCFLYNFYNIIISMKTADSANQIGQWEWKMSYGFIPLPGYTHLRIADEDLQKSIPLQDGKTGLVLFKSDDRDKPLHFPVLGSKLTG